MKKARIEFDGLVFFLGIVGIGLSEIPNSIKLPLIICFFIVLLLLDIVMAHREKEWVRAAVVIAKIFGTCLPH